MPKRRKGGGGGTAQKRAAFFRSVKEENLPTLRWSITHGGFNPTATEDPSGHCAVQISAVCGTVRAMETILDHLKRMRELNTIYECLDGDERNILMMAAAKGQFKIVALLSNYQGLSKDRLWKAVDASGKTARDYAVARKHQDIVDFFDGKYEESEEEDDGDGAEREFVEKFADMTKIKVSAAATKEVEKEAADAASSEGATKVTEPVWSEVKECLEAATLPDRTMWKRDLLVERRPEEDDDTSGEAAKPPVPPSASGFEIDPALWRCTTLNVLKMRLPRGAVTAFPAGVSQLKSLGTLIISGNLIESLPESIGRLTNLKVLEASGNAFKQLPAGLSKCSKLEVIDVSGNFLASLEVLKPLTQLVSVHADNNQLTSLDGLSFENLERLVDLSCSNNKISELPSEIGMLSGSLMTLNMCSNELEGVPSELGNLKKKLQKMLFAENPIKDPRVKKNLVKAAKGGRDLKEALKFLAKQKGGKKSGKKKGGKRR
eukprot:g3466.t1